MGTLRNCVVCGDEFRVKHWKQRMLHRRVSVETASDVQHAYDVVGAR